jgi:hypothetical protein
VTATFPLAVTARVGLGVATVVDLWCQTGVEDLCLRAPAMDLAWSVVDSVLDRERSAAVWTLRSVPLGKYWCSNPLVFSLVGRCHGCRARRSTPSSKYAAICSCRAISDPWSRVRVMRAVAGMVDNVNPAPTM